VLVVLVVLVHHKQNVLLNKIEHLDEQLEHPTMLFDQAPIQLLQHDLDEHLLLQITH